LEALFQHAAASAMSSWSPRARHRAFDRRVHPVGNALRLRCPGDGLCSRFMEVLGTAAVVATGGLAPLISPFASSIQHGGTLVDPSRAAHRLRAKRLALKPHTLLIGGSPVPHLAVGEQWCTRNGGTVHQPKGIPCSPSSSPVSHSPERSLSGSVGVASAATTSTPTPAHQVNCTRPRPVSRARDQGLDVAAQGPGPRGGRQRQGQDPAGEEHREPHLEGPGLRDQGRGQGGCGPAGWLDVKDRPPQAERLSSPRSLRPGIRRAGARPGPGLSRGGRRRASR